MSPSTRSSTARAESVPISRLPSTPKPRLVPYVEIPVFRGGLGSRNSTPAPRASSVVANGHASLKRKGSEQGPEETPVTKRQRKPRVPGPPITLAERAQSAAAIASIPPKYLRSTPRRSVAPESRRNFKVPELPAKVLRPPRRSPSPREDRPETVSAPPVFVIISDDEGASGPRPRTPSPVQEEPPALNGEQEPQLHDPPLTEVNSAESHVVEAAIDAPDSTLEGASGTGRRGPGRPRTLPRDAEGNSIKPGTTRTTTARGRSVTQVIKRRPGRPRRDGGELVTVVQDGVESAVRSRDLRSAPKKTRRRAISDEESGWEEEESEDEDQARGPATRFRMPVPPTSVPPGPPEKVPQDVMAAYASHAALLQSQTEAGMPQLYAAFQTFWIPRRANYFVLMGGTASGLPYTALTSQGGGPGSSTAVHLSNPSFFYWDPLPLVPGGIRCPAAGCSNFLQQAGLVKQPKRVYMEGNNAVSSDQYVGFWIIAARYKCQKCGVRGTSNPKVYSSYVAWDQRILEHLPPLIRSEFPAVEKKKNGRRSFFAAEVALPPEHRMDPQFVSTMIPTQPEQPQPDPNSETVPEPDGPSEALAQPDPDQSTAPANLGPTNQPDHPGLPHRDSPPAQVPEQTQPLASGAQESEELGEAAGRLFAELLFEVTERQTGESEGTQVQAGAGTSQAVEPSDGPNEPLEVELRVPEGEDVPLPTGSSAEGQSGQLQGSVADSTVPAEPSSTSVGVSAASSSNLPSGGPATIGVLQVQSQPEYPILNPSPYIRPAQPSPTETSSSSSTPPGPSTFAAPGQAASSSTGLQPYFTQFNAPMPHVTAPPQIHYFNPFSTPGASSSTTLPPIPSWPTTLSSAQPELNPNPTVSPYSILAGAVVPSPEADHMAAAQAPGLPIPVIGSFNAQSQVVVQVKKRRGPRKCSKCLQPGCKGANGVQYCPNPCIGCKQVDCKKPHTMRGNLCVEGNGPVTGASELVPLEPSPSNSDSANGSGGPEGGPEVGPEVGPDAGPADVQMQDAEGELEHDPDRSVEVGTTEIIG